jgi:uncharacterized protein YdhG (YjbR/CyaY superfamily)
MRIREVDEYIASQPEPKRTTLSRMRDMIHQIIPEVGEVMSHGVPYFTYKGKKLCGIAAAKNHMLYFTHTSTILPAMLADLQGYSFGKASVQFPIDTPLPRELLERLVAVRVNEIG